MMSKKLYNCIIIGGGPAGARAAYELSKKTKNIALIDYRESLGDKLCTGIIGTECVEKYGIDKNLIFSEGNSADITNPGKKTFYLESKEPKAYIIDRIKYVQNIIQKAKDNNTEILYKSRVTDISFSKNDAKITFKSKGIEKEMLTKSIILASGLENKLINKLNINSIKNENILNGSQLTMSHDTTPQIENTKVFLGSKFGFQGFGWIVPTKKNEILIGVLTKDKSRKILIKFISELKNEFRLENIIEKNIKTWGIPIQPLEKTYAERTLVIGDAAGLVKPVTGGGIYYSQISAELAAETIEKAIIENDFSEKSFSAYQKNWKNLIGGEILKGNKLRDILFGFEDKKLNHLTKFTFSNSIISNILISKSSSFDNHFKSFLNFINNENIINIFTKSKSSEIKELIPNLKKKIF